MKTLLLSALLCLPALAQMEIVLTPVPSWATPFPSVEPTSTRILTISGGKGTHYDVTTVYGMAGEKVTLKMRIENSGKYSSAVLSIPQKAELWSVSMEDITVHEKREAKIE
jgi:hypothetical protein